MIIKINKTYEYEIYKVFDLSIKCAINTNFANNSNNGSLSPVVKSGQIV